MKFCFAAACLVAAFFSFPALGQLRLATAGDPKASAASRPAPVAMPVVPEAPPPVDFNNPRIPFSNDAVEQAIDKAVEYLMSKQQDDGSWSYGDIAIAPNAAYKPPPNEPHKVGATALVTYALMEKGLTNQDERIARALKWLADPEHNVDHTYAVALSCQVWLRAWKQTRDKDRDSANKYKKLLAAEVDKLVRGVQPNGGYTYRLVNKPRAAANSTYIASDNSNSQYGVLGVWAGARAELEIPRSYWEKVLNYWLAQQVPDGGWNYRFNNNPAMRNVRMQGSASMTAAGVASLFVCADAVLGDRFIRCNVGSEYEPIKKGLDWYAANLKKVICPEEAARGFGNMLYTMYGIERIGLASGFKYFGDGDWYRLGCIRLLNEQLDDGSWRESYGKDISSAYALLFLIRGQRGVLLNRLEYDGDWNNRPRALAHFCRWAENIYEQPEINWQIVTLKSAVDEWHDAPVLMLTGSRPPKFSDQDVLKLRTFVNQGGTLFSISECRSATGFGKGMREAYAKIFPRYELAAVDKEHPIYSCQYKLPGEPAFFIVSNGVRPLAIHTDADLPLSWQMAAFVTGKANFEAAANVVMLVTDRQIRNRGTRLWPEESAKPAQTIKVARIRYGGNYDPEPLAMERMSRLMAKQYGMGLDVAVPPAARAASVPASAAAVAVAETALAPSELTEQVKIAFMTGTGAFTMAEDEKLALKNWVQAGGLLLIDPAGTSSYFAESARELVGELWGAESLKPLPLDSTIYQLKDMKIEKVAYRRATRVRIGAGMKTPRLLAVLDGQRPRVIFSTEDLTAALVGYSMLGLDGYESGSAFDLIRNICCYVQPPPASMPASVSAPASVPVASAPVADPAPTPASEPTSASPAASSPSTEPPAPSASEPMN